MTLREYAQQQGGAGQSFAQGAAPAPSKNPIAIAQKVIAQYRLNHEIAEGCRLQILQGIESKENPYKLLLCAAEAIGRLDFRGDTFYLQVQEALKQAHGYDITEGDSSETE